MTELHGLLLLGVFVGGTVRGFAGFGGPMVVIPLLSIFVPPATAVWIVALIDLPPNIFMIPTAWRHATARIFVPLAIGSVLTLGIGAYALVMIDAVIMQRVISAAIIVACAVLLSGWMYRGYIATSAWLGVGALSGLVAGATLIAVVTSVFLNAASRDAQANRANFIVWGFVMASAMVLILGSQQPSTAMPVSDIVLLAAVYFAGCLAGTLGQQRFQSPYIRQATLALITLIATSSLAGSFGLFK